MQHIIELGVTFDEKKIQDQLYANAYGEIIYFLENKALEELPKRWNRGGYEASFESLIDKAVENIINEYKEQIIQEAIDKVAASIKRRKPYKEMVEKFEETL